VVGTLVLCLPSVFIGGSLEIETDRGFMERFPRHPHLAVFREWRRSEKRY
jgi:hypothetical protein